MDLLLDSPFDEIRTARTPELCPKDDSLQAVVIANVVANCASLLGCLFNVVLIYTLRNYKEPLTKMVLIICFSDFVYAFSNIALYLQLFTAAWIIQVFSVLGTVFFLSSLMWTCMFARALFLCVKHESTAILAGEFPKFLIRSIPLPILYGIYVLILLFFEPNPRDIKLQEYRGVDLINLTLLVIPGAGVIIYATTYYVWVIRMLRQSGNSTPLELLIYPAILIFCLIPSELIMIYKWAYYECAGSLGVAQFVLVAVNLQGLLNAFVYGIAHLSFKKCCKRCRKQRERQSRLTESSHYLSMQATIEDEFIERKK